MIGYDWERQIRDWVLKRRNTSTALAEAIIRFFSRAFEHARRPQQSWFGIHSSSVSLVVGRIYLASVSSSGGVWLLVDSNPPQIEGLEYRPVKSTRKSKAPLVWAHTTTIEEVVRLLVNDPLWESFSQASEKIFDSPISRGRSETWQFAHGKKRLSDFWTIGKESVSEPESIWAQYDGGKEFTLPDEVNEEVFHEGALRRVTVNAFERNTAARQKCVEIHGASCLLCGFDFGSFYGAEMASYIHVHHLKQLSDIGKTYVVNPETDLIPVCPNCHAVIHSRKPPYTIQEVQAMIRKR